MKCQTNLKFPWPIFCGLTILLHISTSAFGQNGISNSQILFDDYSDSGMPVTEASTTTTTTTTTSTSTASPQLVSMRPSPWLTIPESAFPFPLIPASGPIRAIAVLQGNTNMRGAVVFDQRSPNEAVIISARLSGLEPNGEHGMHVHGSGDLSEGCQSASSHFNPFNLIHGAPGDMFRHAGDLGNIRADGNGNVVFSRPDFILSLSGPFSILGRSVVIHEKADDLGHGNNTDSKKSGNAGLRIACGVIGMTSSQTAAT